MARVRGDRVGVGTPILAELIAGIELSNDPQRHLATMWRNLAQLSLWAFDRAAAIEFGKLYAQSRRAGRNMQIPDLQMAAIAFSLGNCVVVSKDSDLGAVPGLTVEDWAQP
jgi:tRNA(fMet)-specific endonuclease VapC